MRDMLATSYGKIIDCLNRNRAVMAHEPFTTKELSEKTGVRPTTVASVCKLLVDTGLLEVQQVGGVRGRTVFYLIRKKNGAWSSLQEAKVYKQVASGERADREGPAEKVGEKEEAFASIRRTETFEVNLPQVPKLVIWTREEAMRVYEALHLVLKK